MLERFLNVVKRRLISYIIAYTVKILMRVIFSTCRVHIYGLEEFIKVAEKHKCILMLWHDRLILVAEVLKKYVPQFTYTAFISKSCDAEALAIFSQSYSFGRVIRVPHNARHLALSKMIHHLKSHQEIIIITPDGPRGPRHLLKPGVAIASKEAQAKIVPFYWDSNSFWCLKTWDRLMIPKPFSKICVHFGEAISLWKDAGNGEDEMAILQRSMQSRAI